MMGKILKKIRENLGIKQIDAARGMNMCRSDLCMIEGDKRGISSKKIKSILEFYEGREWNLTPLEEKILDDFLNNKREVTKENIETFTRVEMINCFLKGFNYELELDENQVNKLYDNLEYTILSFLIENKKI